MADVVYTIGIIVALLLLLFFLRSIFLRRIRAQRLFAASNPTIVVGGGWRDGGVGNMGRPGVYRTPTDRGESPVRQPDAAHLRGGDEDVDTLPRYEAPPPGYDAVVKDREREGVVGEGSRSEPPNSGSEPPRYGEGDAVIQVQPPGEAPPVVVERNQGGFMGRVREGWTRWRG